jgi:hypothetical protein
VWWCPSVGCIRTIKRPIRKPLPFVATLQVSSVSLSPWAAATHRSVRSPLSHDDDDDDDDTDDSHCCLDNCDRRTQRRKRSTLSQQHWTTQIAFTNPCIVSVAEQVPNCWPRWLRSSTSEKEKTSKCFDSSALTFLKMNDIPRVYLARTSS